MAEKGFKKQRRIMVKKQLVSSGIFDPRVLEAMEKVPRHRFMPINSQKDAYKNQASGIGEGQTISQPYIVALMTQLLQLSGKEKVLEIGTGSGYQTAILAELSKEVFSIERHKNLAQTANSILSELGYHNIQIKIGDGSAGMAKHANYNAIIVTAATPSVPEILLEQLAEGGRLVAPVGSEKKQHLTLFQRQGKTFHESQSVPVIFVPLIGKLAWDEKEWTRLRSIR